MADTRIEWAEKSWNPVTGCSPVSAGCAHCYARRMATRLAGRCGYPQDEPFRVTLHPERLDEPLHWRKPRRIFVCSMGDLFHEHVPAEFIHEVFNVCVRAQHHQFIILTKRPARMAMHLAVSFVRPHVYGGLPVGDGETYSKHVLPNVWLGVTAENQATADQRIPLLLQCPAAVRFVSYEPALGALDLTDYLPDQHDGHPDPRGGPWLDWVVAGGETGPGARPAHPDWFRAVRDQCRDAGAAFFFKRHSGGSRRLDGLMYEEYPDV